MLNRLGGAMALAVLLLPNEEHESIVETICQSASDIWDEAFPGVPGGADWERWA